MSPGFRRWRKHLGEEKMDVLNISLSSYDQRLRSTFKIYLPIISHYSSAIRRTDASLTNTNRRWIFNDSFLQDWNLLPFWQCGFLLLTCKEEEESGAICCPKVWIGGLFLLGKNIKSCLTCLLSSSDAIMYLKCTFCNQDVTEDELRVLDKKYKHSGGIIKEFSETTRSWNTCKRTEQNHRWREKCFNQSV